MDRPDDPLPPPDALADLDRRHVWHPFTHMQPWIAGDPLVIVRGEGMRLQDSRGRWYWDGTSSLWVNVHGHRHPRLDAALRAQIDRVAHSTLLGLANAPSILLAERLSALTRHALPRVFFSDNGAGAVEAALKIAVQYHANRGDHGRRFVLGFTNNYHGDTLGAVGVAYDEAFHGPFRDLLPGHPRAPFPGLFRSPFGRDPAAVTAACLAETGRVLAAHAGRIAALIVEPVQGAGGIVPAPPGFLPGLRRLADAHGALLIVDEVATGFGRTGTMFAIQAEGVVPDLLCLGKGITGGYLPVAATLAREAVFSEFLGPPESGRTFFHGHSYTGNPLGCAVALESLAMLVADVLPALPAKVERVRPGLAPLRDLPHVGDVRQAGLMVGIELVADRAAATPFPYRLQAGLVPARRARDAGLLVRPIGNTLIFMPPLAATAGDLDAMLGVLRDAVAGAQGELARIAAEAGA